MQTNGSWFPSSTELGRPLTLGSVLVFVSIIRTYRRELDELRGHSVTMRTIASEQGLVGLGPSGTILEGWVLLQQKQVERGVAQMREGVAEYEATSLPLLRPWYLGRLAQALGTVGMIEQGLESVDAAIARVERSGERWCEAGLYRIRGELALAAPGGPAPRRARARGRPVASRTAAAAEACFLKSIETARRQGAKSWELRAATSLSRLRHGQGRVKEARDGLAEIYGWFSEDFDTPDLRAASALMTTLA